MPLFTSLNWKNSIIIYLKILRFKNKIAIFWSKIFIPKKKKLISKIDLNGDGEISFEEFLKLVNFYLKNTLLNYS